MCAINPNNIKKRFQICKKSSTFIDIKDKHPSNVCKTRLHSPLYVFHRYIVSTHICLTYGEVKKWIIGQMYSICKWYWKNDIYSAEYVPLEIIYMGKMQYKQYDDPTETIYDFAVDVSATETGWLW